MSIPTPFNPLGTLGAVEELPYIQPVMTSATTWSNEPSFGVVVSGDTHYTSYPVWAAMAGPVAIGSLVAYKMWVCVDGDHVIFTFAKPLRFESISAIVPNYTRNPHFSVYGTTSSGRTLLGEKTFIYGQRTTIDILDKNYYSELEFVMSGTGGNCTLADIQFKAYYKP